MQGKLFFIEILFVGHGNDKFFPIQILIFGMLRNMANRKFHFCAHRNFRVFFLNGKRPRSLNIVTFRMVVTFVTLMVAKLLR